MNVSKSNNQQEDWRPSTSAHEIILWCTTYSLIAAAVICANVFAIFVFTIKRLLRKRSNILLLNLATADLMIGGIAVPMFVYIFYNSHKSYLWRNMVAHQVYLSVDIFAGLSSMFILAVIALERAYSVFRPLKHRCSSTRSRFYWLSAAGVWVTAGVLTSLNVLRSKRILTSSYNNSIILTFVLVALVTILVAHASIWTKMKSREKSLDYIIREKSLAQAMLIVTVTFLAMWLPFYLLNVIGSFDKKVLLTVPPNVIYSAKLMQYGNSFVNPIIYTLKLPQFRKALRKLSYKSSIRIDRNVPTSPV